MTAIFTSVHLTGNVAGVRPFNLINPSETAGAGERGAFKSFQAFKTLRRFNVQVSRFKELTKFQPFKRFKSFKSSITFKVQGSRFKVHRNRTVPVVPSIQTDQAVERVQSMFESVFPQASRKAWAISKFDPDSLTV
jgi:hypothetical protein